MNPPYRKIGTSSRHRTLLSGIGVETTNLYAAFLAVAVNLLRDGGQLVAITPRSFCNGPYFRGFRRWFLSEMTLRHIHVFDARDTAFKGNGVLQENIVFRATSDREQIASIVISSSGGPEDPQIAERSVAPSLVVHPGDPEAFIRLVPDQNGQAVAGVMERLSATLPDLGLSVSTGRVVDFRAVAHLRERPEPGTAPLIYPVHCRGGLVTWPKLDGRKPNAIAIHEKTEDLLVPAGYYVLVKRFSAKEERRRVVAVVCMPQAIASERVAFENHLNYYHRGGRGLEKEVAIGLAVFLNSTAVDLFFRQFSGHTQVNANDLRNLRYPSREALIRLGQRAEGATHDQASIDALSGPSGKYGVAWGLTRGGSPCKPR
jgi:adenine-specific DNA-methyltransferase